MSFSKIGHYQIIEKIGKGHLGTVYRAHDPQFERDVALKVISLAEDERLRLLFLRKMQTLLSFEHPAVVPIYDFGQEDGRVFIVSKLMIGGSLADELEQKSYSFSEIVDLFSALAPAIDDAHVNNIIHDHLSPSNILFDHRGRPYLSDFGLHRFLIEVYPPTLNQEVVGNPAYMSPEQLYHALRAQAGLQQDQRSDIYALGVILFELLTGQIPYRAHTSLGIALGHVNDSIPDITINRSDLPSGIQEVIERVLAKSPNARYPTAMALSQTIMALSKNPINVSESFTSTSEVTEKSDPTSSSSDLNPHDIVLLEENDDYAQGQFSAKNIAGRENKADQEGQQRATEQEETESTTKKPVGSSFRFSRWIGGVGLVLLIALFGWFFTNGSLFSELIPAPAPILESGSIQTSPKDDAAMVYVPAGEFIMGSQADDPNAYNNEKPQHTITLDSYWIDQTEVTNAMFTRFIEETGYQTEAEQAGYGLVYSPLTDNWEKTDGASWKHPIGPGNNITSLNHYPVVQVSWNDADAYCKWADRRLPTEAEWEKAARGTDGRQYPWGNDFNGENLNYCDTNCIMINNQDTSTNDDYLDLAPIGIYPEGSSPYNALDMSGNVWEWVGDWFDEAYYQTTPSSNPLGPETGTYRTLRGGSWSNGNIFVRNAVRTGSLPNETIDNLGFRCAMSP